MQNAIRSRFTQQSNHLLSTSQINYSPPDPAVDGYLRLVVTNMVNARVWRRRIISYHVFAYIDRINRRCCASGLWVLRTYLYGIRVQVLGFVIRHWFSLVSPFIKLEYFPTYTNSML